MTPITRIFAIVTSTFLALLGAAATNGEPLDECGSFFSYGGCVWFDSYEAGVPARIIHDAPADLPSVARVRGAVIRCGVDCGGLTALWCIESATVEECPSQELGCGVFEYKSGDLGTACYLWDSDSLGTVLVDPEDVAGYALGDSLRATGVLGYAEFSLCHEPIYFARVSLAPCDGEPVQVNAATWGRVKVLYR